MNPLSLKHDGEIQIAVGKSRKDINWKNISMLWSEFVAKISSTVRTYETFTEYMNLPKAKQDEIKDVGGFVGGFLTGGRRKQENVLSRSVLVLDIDFGDTCIWDDFELVYGNAAVIYSTHKHCPDKPRLRICIPLLREVTREEYEPLGRMVARDFGINHFDDTTYEASRLMYWPSTPKDGKYFFRYCDGFWLDPNSVLSRYRDWCDSSAWPQSERVKTVIHKEIKKQGSPLDKPGLIGAFCRAYTIQEAIEVFLSDSYEHCETGRYTYRHGSTTAGLVIYEDTFAYSHHGTDPVSGKLCNAFDLVRLHLFGIKDEDAAENTPVNKLPSFMSMLDMVSGDANARRLLAKERLTCAKTDFEGLDLDSEDFDWMTQLDTDKKGVCKSTIDNIMLVLKNDCNLKGKLALNLFERREVSKGDLPWRKITNETKYLTDKDDAGVRHYVEKNYHITGIQKISDAINLALLDNAYHPIRDYFNTLGWDGVRRIDTLFIDYLGVKDTVYTRAVTRKTLAAAVARVLLPGIKFDYVLTLVGPQGIGKSTLVKRLGMNWYSDSFSTVIGREAYEQIQGVWIVEISELAGLRKAEFDQIKQFISKTDDRYRVAYGRRVENFPRQCIFIGTVNTSDFLKDPTGNRRFWPLDAGIVEPSKDIFTELNDYEVGQIWAEAIKAFGDGEELYLPKELEEAALFEQEKHSQKDDRAGVIAKYLEMLLPDNWNSMDVFERRNCFMEKDESRAKGVTQRERVCVAEIWCECFGGQQKDMNRYNTKEIHDIMRKMEGWDSAKSNLNFPIYGKQRAYIRAD